MDKSYLIEHETKEGRPLIKVNTRDTKIKFIPGLSTADSENPDRPRKREEYLEQVLNPMIERGEIGDGVKEGTYDDRKFRFDSASRDYEATGYRITDFDVILEIGLGITHYQECADCRDWDEGKKSKMVEEGERIFNEPHAFFTRGCGIEVTPITAEGHIFAGKRNVPEEASGYGGELATVNGWVDYLEKLEDVDFTRDALREMHEEYGILEKDLDELIFSGIFSATSMADTDFVYLAPLRIGNNEFLGKYESRQDKELGELVKIASYQDMQALLQTGRLPEVEGKFNVLYSLRASLEQIRPDEMA